MGRAVDGHFVGECLHQRDAASPELLPVLGRNLLAPPAAMLMLTVVTRDGPRQTRQDVVLRLRPKPPALLEPYDLARQFRILRALQDTEVRVPRPLWLEETGEVLGRPFFVMERAAGEVYEMQAPADVADDTVLAMCRSLVEQLAAIHSVGLTRTGLDALDDGNTHLDRELDHWAAEMNRVKRGSLPALERLHRALRERHRASTVTARVSDSGS